MKIRNLRIAFLGAGLLFACGLAILSLFLRYGGDLRSLTPWQRLHSANLVRGERVVGTAWVYGNRRGDYLVFTKENPNFGPYLLRSGKVLVASCAWNPLGQPGAKRIWTPAYIDGWTGCISMDGVKTPKTTARLSSASIDFYSEPYDWPPDETGAWRVEW
jgi:hypothetical protein